MVIVEIKTNNIFDQSVFDCAKSNELIILIIKKM